MIHKYYYEKTEQNFLNIWTFIPYKEQVHTSEAKSRMSSTKKKNKKWRFQTVTFLWKFQEWSFLKWKIAVQNTSKIKRWNR